MGYYGVARECRTTRQVFTHSKYFAEHLQKGCDTCTIDKEIWNAEANRRKGDHMRQQKGYFGGVSRQYEEMKERFERYEEENRKLMELLDKLALKIAMDEIIKKEIK